MSKLPNSNSDNGDENGVRPTEDRPPSTPRWVKVSGIIIIVLVLLFVIMMFIGGGKHGPGRHGSGAESAKQIEQEALGEHAPPEVGHTLPGGGH